jgi:hypothetical protein
MLGGGHVIRSEVLFALGLTLTELCLGQTLADLEESCDVVSGNKELTMFNTARRLLSHVFEEGGENYENVVHRCLYCPFHGIREWNFENDEFQQRVFEMIVAPLAKDWSNFNGGLDIDLAQGIVFKKSGPFG